MEDSIFDDLSVIDTDFPAEDYEFEEETDDDDEEDIFEDPGEEIDEDEW